MNHLEEAMAKIAGIEKPSTERMEAIETDTKDLRAALDALIEKLAG